MTYEDDLLDIDFGEDPTAGDQRGKQDTSKAAHIVAQKKKDRDKKYILQYIVDNGPSSSADVVAQLGKDPKTAKTEHQTISARFSDLKAEGKIRDSGLRGKNKKGNSVALSILTTPEEKVAWLRRPRYFHKFQEVREGIKMSLPDLAALVGLSERRLEEIETGGGVQPKPLETFAMGLTLGRALLFAEQAREASPQEEGASGEVSTDKVPEDGEDDIYFEEEGDDPFDLFDDV